MSTPGLKSPSWAAVESGFQTGAPQELLTGQEVGSGSVLYGAQAQQASDQMSDPVNILPQGFTVN